MAGQENSLRPSVMRDSENFSKITEAMCTESTNRFVTGQRREEYYEGKNNRNGKLPSGNHHNQRLAFRKNGHLG